MVAAQPKQLVFPQVLTKPIEEVLSIMIYQSGPIAEVLRGKGKDIPRKAEAEQAFVLHWLITLALEHGEKWRPIAMNELK